MTTDNHVNYISIEKIVIDNLKKYAKQISSKPINNWPGDAWLTEKQLKKEIQHRKKIKKGAKMLLEGFKLLNY